MSKEELYELLNVKPIDQERYECNMNYRFDYDENENDIDEAMKIIENLFDD